MEINKTKDEKEFLKQTGLDSLPKTIPQQPKEEMIPKSELAPNESELKIGDIIMRASVPVEELASWALWILQQPEIKSYLDIIKQQKSIGVRAYT